MVIIDEDLLIDPVIASSEQIKYQNEELKKVIDYQERPDEILYLQQITLSSHITAIVKNIINSWKKQIQCVCNRNLPCETCNTAQDDTKLKIYLADFIQSPFLQETCNTINTTLPFCKEALFNNISEVDIVILLAKNPYFPEASEWLKKYVQEQCLDAQKKFIRLANSNVRPETYWWHLVALMQAGLHLSLLPNLDKHKILNAAAFCGDVATARCLLEQNSIMLNNPDALFYAASNGQLSIIRLFCEYGADINIQHKDGTNAFMIAAMYNHVPVIEFLLEHGADVNASNAQGVNTLMFAAQNGHLPAVKFLLEHRANPHQQESRGDTALIIAQNSGHITIVDLLSKASAQ